MKMSRLDAFGIHGIGLADVRVPDVLQSMRIKCDGYVMTPIGAAILPFISQVRDRRMSKRIPSQLGQGPNHIGLSPAIRRKR
jgi:hypothetical protein